jgi:hypothetical protein
VCSSDLDHTVEAVVLPARGTLWKFPSGLYLLLKPKLTSRRVAMLLENVGMKSSLGGVGKVGREGLIVLLIDIL